MNALRKHLFKLLMAVACLGIANEALAQEGPGIRSGMLDGNLRTISLDLPFVKMGGLQNTSTITPANAVVAGRNGSVAVGPRDTTVAFSTGMTQTTSIGAMPYPARVAFHVFPQGTAASMGCQRLTVYGLDQFGREVGPNGTRPAYTFGPLVYGSPHTSSIAFAKITRIRLDYCTVGSNCATPGSGTCNTTPGAGSQFRAYMTRHVGLQFRIKSLANIKSICVYTSVLSMNCFNSDAGTIAVSGGAFTPGAFSVDPTRNTLSFPNMVNGTTRPSIGQNGPSTYPDRNTITLQDNYNYFITYKSEIGAN